jgi:hypothetical protein
MSARNRNRKLENRMAKRAADALRDGEIQKGSIYVMKICHDEWCDLLNGVGECNCNPDIEKPKRLVMPEDN